MHTRVPGWTNRRKNTGFFLILMVLPVLAACAAGAVMTPESVEPAPVLTGPSVKPLEEGREGFIITEAPPLDEPLRRDFDHAVTLMNAQDYEQASALLEKVIERSPGVTAPYINLAIAYRHQGRPEQAEKHLKKALELFPEHPAACNEYGLLCRRDGRFAEARAFYEKALAHFPDYYPVRRNLGILCDLYLNDTDCALEQYEIYSAARPEDQQVKFWMADLRNRLGRQ